MNRGNWTDNPCWYVSVQDAGRTALVLGPFRAESECRQYAYREMEEGGNSAKRHQVDKAAECDPRSWFYSWGMVKMQNGRRDGCLNSRMPETVHGDMGRMGTPPLCQHCGSVLSAVTWTCVRGEHCPGAKAA